MTLPADGPYSAYLDALLALVARIKQSGAEIRAAADLVADTLAVDGLVHTFGTGHSHLLAEEAFFRAGGLAAVNPIRDARLMMLEGALASTAAEREPGLARAVLEGHDIRRGDTAILASNSGRNAVPIEMAMEMRERKVKVIAITSVPQARASGSRHPSGRHLLDLADVVLDTGVPPGDALIHVPGVSVPLGPASTVVGAAVLHAVLIEAAARAVSRGHRVAVLRSANLDRADLDAPDLDAPDLDGANLNGDVLDAVRSDGEESALVRALHRYNHRVPALRETVTARRLPCE